MDTAANKGRMWQWVSLFTAALLLPLLIAPTFAAVSGWRLQSTVTRLMMLFAAAVLIARIGVPRVSSPRGGPSRGLGRALGTMLLAMLITVGVCALYTIGLILAGAETLRPWDEIFAPTRLLTALGTGIVVSLIEEPVFRRYLLGRLSLRGSVVTGAVLSSAIYALVHYVRPAKFPIQPSYTIADSWAVYENILTNLLKPLQDPGPGLGLLLFGLLLCVVVRRGGLAATIGIHAGAVYYAKSYSCLVYWNHQGRHPWFGSSDVLYDGALFWIVCACALVAHLLPAFTPRSNSGEEGTAVGPSNAPAPRAPTGDASAR